MPLVVFTMTFTPRDFSSGSSTIAGLCASMTTAAVFGQRCAIQSAAHAVPCFFVSRYSASSMCAVPSEYFMHAPMASALRSGDMSMPNEVTPPSARTSTVPFAHSCGLMALQTVVSSHMPRPSRRNESSPRFFFIRRIAASPVRCGYDGFATVHCLRSSESAFLSALNSTYSMSVLSPFNASSRRMENTSDGSEGFGGVPM